MGPATVQITDETLKAASLTHLHLLCVRQAPCRARALPIKLSSWAQALSSILGKAGVTVDDP